MADSAQTSGLAIASLVCGVLGFLSGGLLGFVGVILGIVALVSIGSSQGRLGGRGIAIGGLATSACSVVLGCALLAGLMLPALGVARTNALAARTNAMAARDQACVKQGQAEVAGYAADHGGRLPSGAVWRDAMIEAAGEAILTSVRTGDPRPAFSMNEAVAGKELLAIPATAVVFFECEPGGPAEGGRELLPAEPRYTNLGYLIGFGDGTVEWVAPDEIDGLNWDASP